MPLRAVLFDAAGTLIRTRESIGAMYARAVRQHGAHAQADRLGRAFALAHAAAPPMLFAEAPASEVAGCERDWWREVVRDTFRRADASPRDFDACFEALYSGFARPEAWVTEPEVHSTLKALRARGLAIAVVSNFDHRLPQLLVGLGLAALIDALVIPSSARAIKPDPAIFQAALSLLDCPAPQAVVVGDDPARDLAAARAAGLHAIDVRELATLADLPARLEDPAISTRSPRSAP